MATTDPQSSPSSTSGTGLTLIRDEMRRQHGDALASFDGAGATAATIAASIRRDNRLLLIGMGGSHWVNRAVEPLYRALGIDATAVVASELLEQPMPDVSRTAILTSQSGASGEILALLKTSAGSERRFGLTLEAESPLARALPSLIGAGGTEKAFAATRSLLISLALHGAVLAKLGADMTGARELLERPIAADVSSAIQALSSRTSFVFSAKGALQGIAEAGALCLMELARVPALALEAGQFRHGPLEILGPQTGVILLRGAGSLGEAAAGLAKTSIAAGTQPVIFDASGSPAIAGAVTVSLPKLDGMAAIFALLPSLQQLLVEIAIRKVDKVGEPLRSTKVTGLE